MREDGAVWTRSGPPWTAPRGPLRSAFAAVSTGIRRSVLRPERRQSVVGAVSDTGSAERHTAGIRATELMARLGCADGRGDAWMTPSSRYRAGCP